MVITIVTLMFWFGSGIVTGAALLAAIAFLGLLITSAFGWEVTTWR